MPCHLIVAHSNSWSSDTDKWTCIITLDFFVTFHSVKTASAQHVTKKQTRAIAVSSINLGLFLSALCLYSHNPTATWQRMEKLMVWWRGDGWWSEGDGWISRPSLPFCKQFLPCECDWAGVKWTFFVLSKAASRGKREKWGGGVLIKIQLSLTFSLLPFQSFYSFKSLTISMKLKGSASHLWNSDTFDNNAFEELVTSSSQISLINAQTVSLFSLLLFSWFLSN